VQELIRATTTHSDAMICFIIVIIDWQEQR
jgi:hypothetical protein